MRKINLVSEKSNHNSWQSSEQLYFLYRLLTRLDERRLGFTLIETLAVVIIIGILAAIAGPSWVAFMEARKLSVAQGQLFQALQEAQSNAKRDKITWEISFRENGGYAQWSVHPASVTSVSAMGWQKLDSAIRIVDTDINSSDPNATTFYYDDADSVNSFWKMQFNYKGNANGQIGKITLATRNNSQNKKCVIVSTLLGAMKMAQDSQCN